MGVVFVILFLLLAVAGGTAPPQADRTVGDLRLEVTSDRSAYAPGDPVLITLRVTNTTSLPVELTTRGQEFDAIVRQRGALIWQWSHDKAFAQIVREVTLAPGRVLTYKESWDQRDLQGRRVEAGTYEIYCVFFGSQRAGPASSEVGPVRIVIGR